MKAFLKYILIIGYTFSCSGQLLPGTLYGTAGPTYSQTLGDLVSEAGEDDGAIGYETGASEVQITFRLDPSTFQSSAQNCSANIYKYKVFMHLQNAPTGLVLEARTFSNAGTRFPVSIPYDAVPVNGTRDLYPENGGNYIVLPTDNTAAIKVFEFTGCRDNIPIQFRVAASVLSQPGATDTEIYYTVTGSIN
ncbi:hypothetical protein [Maribacter sp.]|uniref:hypothetical protein n=1 Tax=Maribacter sp. TaxID=1897614 RepID=UPI0032998BD6